MHEGNFLRNPYNIPQEVYGESFRESEVQGQLSVAAGVDHSAEGCFTDYLPTSIFARHDVGEMTVEQAFSIGVR